MTFHFFIKQIYHTFHLYGQLFNKIILLYVYPFWILTDMTSNCYCMEKCKNYFQKNIKAYAVCFAMWK